MIRGIVFDLDGTLWNTEEAYIDTYRRISKDFPFCNATDDEVRACLGQKLEEVVKRLFSGFEDKKQIAQLSVQYVIEYCLRNPHFYSDNLVDIFKTLSKKYNLYIISNCPRDFLDSFLTVSKISEYLVDTFSITEGAKNEHLRKITKNYTERILFVGDSQYDYDEIENHSSVHFCFAKYGYLDCEKYEYYINSLDEIVKLANKIEEKERMIDSDDYEIFSCGDTNVTVINLKSYSLFGFIEFHDKNEFSNVLKQIRENTKQEIIGPIDGKTWYSYRLCLDNFDWKLYPDCLSNPEILDCLKENGFKLFHTYSSTLSKINDRIWNYAKKLSLPDEYRSLIIEGKEVKNYIKYIYEIGVNVFDRADYYRPISYDDFKELYLKGLVLINPTLILILKNNKVVAFNYAYEDPEKRFYVCKTIGIRNEERNKVILLKLLDISYDFMTRKNYSTVLHHFQNDRTKTMETLSNGYELKKKKYGLFKYENK